MTSQQWRVGFSVSFVVVSVALCGDGTVDADDAIPPAPPDAVSSPQQTFELTAWLDERFQEIWQANNVEPEICDDGTYLRRVHLDLTGRIPSVAQTRDFLENPAADKRAALVQRLLVDSGDSGRNRDLFAEHQSRIWRRILVPPGSNGAAMGPALDPWLAERFRENTPYDEIVQRLLTSGEGEDARATQLFYSATGGSPDAYATTVTRVFLGVRVGCAQCHPHPFADWTQDDFWGMAAFFVTAVPAGEPFQDAPPPDPTQPARITYEGVTYEAKYLWDEKHADIAEGATPTAVLAEWMTAKGNPTFAETAVNRVWQHLLGRGLVADADELDLASPEERTLILDDLAAMFEDSGYDLRWLVTGITGSSAYQCVSETGDGAPAALETGTRPLKTLTPEQVFDSLEQTLMLPVSQSSDDAARYNGQMAQIVSRLDETAGRSPEEYASGVPQVLMLMNGGVTADATNLERSRTLRAVVDAPFLDETAKIETLFLAALTRQPTEKERATLLEHVRSKETEDDRRKAYGEILWALINSPEFVLCR